MNTKEESVKKIKEGFVGQKTILLSALTKKQAAKNELTSKFHLTEMGYYPLAHLHDREREEGSSQYILLYCTEGSGYVEMGTNRYELTPNTYFIIPKNRPHHYGSYQSQPWSIYWAHFVGEHADLIYERYADKNGPDIRPIPYDKKRIDEFNQIISILENSHHSRELEIANISLFHFIASLVYNKETNPAFYDMDAISSSIAFMKQNIHDFFSIEELARQQNLSVSHYSKLFKIKTGHSPVQYFNQLKVHKSCEYLYFSSRSIKEICAELGFEDPYYFSRLFKKCTGLSPSNYKAQYKK
ncbi:helix-turn-helix domain-containing protein [Mucilaginibacter paludis]|uniref:Transcriptional regulator, AraC family n=1 Tax=Mucilaginibacter paludis DSM 18603 TaxID=714943 RepID=H1YAM6_9SPHI|nr:AraC family transcriptional regulator [Mucilaginibacter paludis]EHQ29146.1 transcriptional regulator, AraC family [Mucilaginibacter paludis DSM 18603]